MNQPIDFYTGEELQPDDISVDHVIPGHLCIVIISGILF